GRVGAGTHHRLERTSPFDVLLVDAEEVVDRVELPDFAVVERESDDVRAIGDGLGPDDLRHWNRPALAERGAFVNAASATLGGPAGSRPQRSLECALCPRRARRSGCASARRAV